MLDLDKQPETRDTEGKAEKAVLGGEQDAHEPGAEIEAGEPESAVADEAAPAETTADEVVISIGDEEPPEEAAAHAPAWVRKVRQQNRELGKRVKDLEGQLATRGDGKAVEAGKKPTLEELDYDTTKYDAALAAWYERKRVQDEVAAKARSEQEEQQREHQARLDDYGKKRGALGVRDFEDAEAVVTETLSAAQQSIILHGCENPALVVYSLGRYPAKAQELAKIENPIRFAFAVAKLEDQVRLTKRSAPAPEQTIRSDARISGSVDQTLDRLRKEAERTGNYSKVAAYKRQKRG